MFNAQSAKCKSTIKEASRFDPPRHVESQRPIDLAESDVAFYGSVGCKALAVDDITRASRSDERVLVVLTGPCGSGKTFTLAAAASCLMKRNVRVALHEDLEKASAAGAGVLGRGVALLVDDVDLLSAQGMHILQQSVEDTQYGPSVIVVVCGDVYSLTGHASWLRTAVAPACKPGIRRVVRVDLQRVCPAEVRRFAKRAMGLESDSIANAVEQSQGDLRAFALLARSNALGGSPDARKQSPFVVAAQRCAKESLCAGVPLDTACVALLWHNSFCIADDNMDVAAEMALQFSDTDVAAANVFALKSGETNAALRPLEQFGYICPASCGIKARRDRRLTWPDAKYFAYPFGGRRPNHVHADIRAFFHAAQLAHNPTDEKENAMRYAQECAAGGRLATARAKTAALASCGLTARDLRKIESTLRVHS